MDDTDFSGFAPFVNEMRITPAMSLLTSSGGLVKGHIMQVKLSDDQEIIASISEDTLKELFFLVLRIVSH
jgi:hypothetical protein